MAWREERDCGYGEYQVRRFVSSGLYFRGFRRLRPDTPFYAPRAVKALAGKLGSDTAVFEWGSGASTLWLARRSRRVVSVEHDPEWYRRTGGAIAEAGVRNVELLFVPPAAPARDFSWRQGWEHFDQLGHPPRKRDFLDYMRAIDAYEDGSFDVIAIDGRERIGCLLHALPKLAPGGYLVFDDSARPKYRELFEVMSDWQVKRYDFGLLQTSIFRRRGAEHR